MPRCDGRADGPGSVVPCPDGRCDSTVRGRQGELMLCDSCNEYRFPSTTTTATTTTTCIKNPVKKPSKPRAAASSSSTSTICTRGKQLQPDATAVSSVAEPAPTVTNTASRSSSCSDTDTMKHCSKCDDIVDSRHLVCDICLESIHPLCAGLTSDVYETLIKIAKETGWVCADCRVLCRNKILRLQSSMSRVYEEMSDMQKQITGLRCELEDIKHAHITTDNPHTRPVTQAIDTETIVSKVLHDANRRKKNIVICGLPEAVDYCETDRHAADLTMFERLCEEHLDVKPAISHLGCRRLGKLGDYANKPRKLLIHLNSETAASSILDSAKQLRHSADAEIAANVFINPDLSPNDLKIAFNLRQQKRARLANGHRPSGTGSRPHVTDITHSTASSVAHSQPCEGRTLSASAPSFVPSSDQE